MQTKLKSCIGLFLAFSLLFPVFGMAPNAVAEHSVTATTSASVKQGSSANCYVEIDSTESLAALDVTVHFDPNKVRISNVYNSVSCTLYDSVKNADSIQFSYLFDGKGAATKTRLFYFSYQVLSGAEIGDAYFDITIGEAYDSALGDVPVSGSRCKFTIAETVSTKTCSVSTQSSVSTSIGKEFTLHYQFSTYQIASGSVQISYDPDLFEIVDVKSGAFLSNKISDINPDLEGNLYLSFAATEYGTKRDLLSITFKTIQNKSETSKITFKANELCDLDLNPISCSDFVTTANVSFDKAYLGNAPKMGVSAKYNELEKKVMATISLDENSRLGAGDFAIQFNPKLLSYSSYQKEFNPDFFYVNEKESSDGVFKFSIISMEDIVFETPVITLIFDVIPSCEGKNTVIDLSGSMLADSLTNPIAFNFIDSELFLPSNHTYTNSHDPDCNECGYVRFTLGDADGDGVLSDWDGIAMARYLAGWDVEIPNPELLDLDGDGEITDWDGVLLDRTLAGWDIKIG